MNQNHTETKLGRIEQLLRQMYRRYRLCRGLWVTYAGLGIFGALLILLLAAEGHFYLPVWIKSAALLISGLLALSFVLLILKRFQPDGWKEFYRRISRNLHLEPLRNVMDLRYERPESSPYVSLALRQNLRELSEDELERSIRSALKEQQFARHQRRSRSIFMGVLLLFVVFWIANPGAVHRVARFWDHFDRPNPYHFLVRPGAGNLEQGEAFQAVLSVQGEPQPGQVRLAFKTKLEKKFRIQKMTRLNDSTFVSEESRPTVPFTYYVTMDGFSSKRYPVTILLRPRFEYLHATVIPPGYTRLDSSRYTYPFTQFQAYPGSEVQFTGRLSKPVQTLRIIRYAANDTLHNGLAGPVPSDSLDIRFRFTHTDSLAFSFTDTSGIKNRDPYAVRIGQLQDENPYVSIIRPGEVVSMVYPDTMSIRYEMSDDFGFHSATMYYQVKKAFAGDQKIRAIRLPVPHRAKAVGSVRWDLTKLDLKPLDEVTYWIEVRDNDRPSGFKEAESSRHLIRMSSMAETIDMTDKQGSSLSGTWNQVQEGAGRIRQQFRKLQDELRSGTQDSYKKQQSVKQMKQEQKALNRKIDQFSKKFNQMKQQLRKDKLLAPETVKKYEELQKLIDRIKNPELMKALEKLQQALQNMNVDALQQAMQKYQFNEKAYQEQLARTLELLKSLRLDIGLNKMTKLLENLGQREEALLEQHTAGKQEAAQQEQIRRDLQQAKEGLHKLEKESPQSARQEMQNLNKNIDPQIDETDQKLQKNIGELGKANPDTSLSLRQQQSIRQQLEEVAKKVQATQSELNQKRARLNIAGLKSILQDLVLLSNAQEDISRAVGNLSDRSPAFVEQAREQHTIAQSFGLVSDSLFALSKQIPALSDQVNREKDTIERNINQALDYLADRHQDVASAQVHTVLAGMNNLASDLATLLDRLERQQNSGSGSSGMSMNQMMQQLRNMSGRQKKLNGNLQQLINDLHGNRLTENQISRLNQMARTQNAIRKQLKGLQENGGLEPGDKLLSELQRMNEQMEKTINDLRGGSADRQLIKRQHNILSRMLSAEKALEERGTQKKRESETAKEKKYAPPPDVTLEQLRKYLRKRMSGAENSRFAPDYQRLIERYFELLEKQLPVDSADGARP